MRGLLIKLAPVTVFLLLALAVTPALASHVQCGDVITQDTTLDSDLIDCPENGIVIGADNITLDLGGHTVDGTQKSGDPADRLSGEGIANFGSWPGPGHPRDPGHDGIVIKNGVIRDFDTGVSLTRVTRNVIRNITVSDNWSAGMWLSSVTHSTVTRNRAFDSGSAGIELYSYDSGPDASNRITRNVTYRNQSGILMTGHSDGTEIERNSVFDNLAGIFFNGIHGRTLIRANSLSRNGVGIWLWEADGPPDSSYSRIEANHITDSGTEVPDETLIGGIRGDGIYGSFDPADIIRNVVSGNDGDGIEVRGPDNVVARNRANQNGDLGIEGHNVTDGGGNKASGNGNPLQCTGVFCK